MCVCNPKNEDKLDDEFIYIYIDLESVEKGVLKSKNIIHLKNAPSRAQRILYKNDILFQSVRPYQRNNYLLNEDDDFLQYVASTGYIQLRTTLNPYSPILGPKSPVFMRVFGLFSLSKPIGKPTKSRNFWCSLTQPECSIHNAA